ncbi:MAG: hypothetical protein SGI96_21295 [Bacteroidota bacterium]|nr:hypothetical protein [Bacteroidota bacterium]
MLNGIKGALIGLIGSKKIQSAAIGALTVLVLKVIPMDQALAAELANGVFIVFLTLIGAQGLTDLGKGDSDKPSGLVDALKKSFGGLMQSKKFYTAIAAVLAYGVVKILKLDSESAQKTSEGILAVAVVLLGSQGLTDLGKAKAE